MSDPEKCPRCGTLLHEDAPAGLCPQCLVAAGLESEAGSQSDRPKSDPEAPTIDSPAPPFAPPEVAKISDNFPQLEILELLGHGGMGAVYKARQPNLDRLVALKIIRPQATRDPAFAERFNREAKTLARLSHQHIVGVYDFGEVEYSEAEDQPSRPLYYFLMEYVDGANLRQLMRSGELSPVQALAIVPQICDALQYAHDEGVVHRDIKPENILLDTRGRVKIADFGLAKLATRSEGEFTLTGTHQVMGTLRYMAPEQMESSHAVDHRADIYSLGVVFYEMLTGEPPMGHFEPPSKKVEIDVRLDEVVLRALAREPERRYQHASEVKTDVESISTGTNPLMTPMDSPTVVDEDAEGSWREFLLEVVHVFLVVVLFLFGLGIFLGGNDAVQSLGLPPIGIWAPLIQLFALLLMITAVMSVFYQWKIPSPEQQDGDVNQSQSPSTNRLAAERDQEALVGSVVPAWLWWRNAAMFLGAWVLTAAMWNFGKWGLYVAGAVFIGLVTAAVRRRVSYAPAHRIDSQAASSFRWLAAVLAFILGYVLLINAQLTSWDLWSFSERIEDIGKRLAASPHRLIRELDAFGEDIPTVEIVTRGGIRHVSFSSVGELLWYWVLGATLVLMSVLTLVQTRKCRWTWQGYLKPSMGLTAAILAPLLFLTGLTQFTGGSLHGRFELRGDADAEQIATALDEWVEEYGYHIRSDGRWLFQTIPEGDTVGSLHLAQLEIASVFDRWGIALGAVVEQGPAFELQLVSSTDPTETIVRIDTHQEMIGPRTHWSDNYPARELEQSLLAKLQSALKGELQSPAAVK